MTNANILSLKKSLALWLWILLFTLPAGAQKVGINTTTPLASLHVDLGDVLFRNNTTVLADPGIVAVPVTGPGTRVMWIAEKSAFRLGTVHNNDWNADSIGTWSTGIGYSTKAKGQFSLALGLQTTASGITSTALGFNTSARGENSIAMGSVTTALGANSTSMGFKTYAASYGSVSLGRYNDTIVNANRTAWIGTDPMLSLGNGTSEASLHNTFVIYKNGNIISKNPTLINSDPGSIPLPAIDPGTRMMWLPEKSAFRAGTVDNNNWNADSLGTWSTGFGYSVKAKGPASFAAGFGSSATGLTSTAFGYSTKASGENSIAMGSVSIASGPVATAMGFITLASGFSSTAMGANTRAIGVNSTSMGFLTTATGLNTTSMGFKTYAKSYGSVALGRYNDRITSSDSTTWIAADPLLMVGNGTSDAAPHNTLVVYKNGNIISKNPTTIATDPGLIATPINGAGTRMMWMPEKSAFRAGTTESSSWDGPNIGAWSFASGLDTEASGSASTALGIFTKASDSGSTAMGSETVASGYSSLAAGGETIASGPYSTSMGYVNRAMGSISSVSGHFNIAKGFSSTVIGLCNDSILLADQVTIDPLTPIFIIGNGDGTGVGQRRNAMVVRKDGHVGIGTNTPATFLHVDVGSNYSDGMIVSGVYNGSSAVPNLGAGSRMNYFPGKAAFRAGRVVADQWDNSNTGNHSFAVGYNTKASAQESSAFGSGSMATGPQAFASGLLTTASGTASTAMGSETMASGDRSTSMGGNTKATGEYSTAIGNNSIASGSNSIAAGFESRARGGSATAIGYRAAANSIYSSAFGFNTIAKGYATTVVGMYNDSMFLVNQVAPTAAKAPLFIVGNGGVAQRNNALVIYKDGDAEIDGYTRLGDSTATSFVPRIKMKKLTGTSAAAQNTWIDVPHGLTKSKILSVNIIMTIPTFENVPPSYTYYPGYEYQYHIGVTNIVVINSATNSYNCTNKPFTILIVYEE